MRLRSLLDEHAIDQHDAPFDREARPVELLDAMSHLVAGSDPAATLDKVTRSARFSREKLFELGYDALVEGLKSMLLKPQTGSR